MRELQLSMFGINRISAFSSIEGLLEETIRGWPFAYESGARGGRFGWQARHKHLSLDSVLLLALALKLKDAF